MAKKKGEGNQKEAAAVETCTAANGSTEEKEPARFVFFRCHTTSFSLFFLCFFSTDNDEMCRGRNYTYLFAPKGPDQTRTTIKSRARSR